jgi:tetratricopeptide (TPR) repeat protein
VLTRLCWFVQGPILGLALVLGAAEPLHAQAAPSEPPSPTAPTDEEQMRTLDDEARQRFELGRTFYEAGRFAQAAEEFAEAYRLSQRPQLLYNLYVAHRDAANWQGAIEALRGYLEKVPDVPDRITLRARLKSMEEQAARQQQEREQAEAARAREREREQAAATKTETQHSIVPWILAGTGGALLAGSLVTGLMAKSKDDDLDRTCAAQGKLCPSWKRSDADGAYTLAVTTDILWAAGAATAVTGLILWWTGVLDRERQVPIASVDVSSHGVRSTLTVRY